MKTALAVIISLFAAANSHYAAGDFDKAISGYQEIVEKGAAGANLYYNLGNAFLKKGEIGPAVLNYERAMLFAPRDADIRSNYRSARSVMKYKDPLNFNYLTLRETIVLALLLYYILTASCLAWLFLPRWRRYTSRAAAAAVILFLALSYQSARKVYNLEHDAIVMAAVTDARFEPRDDSRAHFPVYDGQKVRILRKAEGWAKVRRSDGKIGWVLSAALEGISQLPVR